MDNPQSVTDIYQHAPSEIRRMIRMKTYARDSILVSQGDRAEDFYIILSGSVLLFHDSENARRHTLTVFYAGDFFGENVLLEEDVRIFTVQALETTEAAVIDRKTLELWIDLDPRFSRFLLCETCRRLKESGSKFILSALYPLRSRIVRLLRSRISRAGIQSLRVSSTALAEELGVTQRSIQRVLRELSEKGVIEYSRGTVRLLTDYQSSL